MLRLWNDLFLGFEPLSVPLTTLRWADWQENHAKSISFTAQIASDSFEHICSSGVLSSDAAGKYVGETIINGEEHKWGNITHQPPFIVK